MCDASRMLDQIRALYAYNAWANRRILDTAEQMTLQRFLAQLSVFRGGWSLEAAEADGGPGELRLGICTLEYDHEADPSVLGARREGGNPAAIPREGGGGNGCRRTIPVTFGRARSR